MTIIRKHSSVHTGYLKNRRIEYLVIHYTAGTSSKKGVARNVATMFANPGSRAASADYIVDDAEVVEYNGDIRNRYTYAVGGDKYASMSTPLGGMFYGKCRNNNSISIEMCSSKANGKTLLASDTDWSITEPVVLQTVDLAAQLLKTYGIPIDRMIMHHQVTGKLCPQPWCLNDRRLTRWYEFRRMVQAAMNEKQTAEKEDGMTKLEIETMVRETVKAEVDSLRRELLARLAPVTYDTIDEVPEWAKDAVRKRVEEGVLEGSGHGLGLTVDLLRTWVVLDREEALREAAESYGMD